MVFYSKEANTAQSVILFKPLDSPQIVSIDAFKQTSILKKINLIFSIRDNSAQASIQTLCLMISQFSKYIKSANFLIINYSNSNIRVPKLKIKGVKNKIDKIRLMDANLYFNDDYVQLETIRHFSKKISKNSLIVYMPSNVKFGQDALKRLVINAKIKKQVFFPIAYNFYPYSAKKSLLNDNGYFDGESKDIVSFYNLDFIKFDNKKIRSTFELFNKSNVEILNVADSDLNLEWTIYKGCHFLNSNDSYKCINRRLNSFGNHLNFLSFLFKN
ncbi:hypothetical protein BpHYR1_048970 [Brachionus plicatilis]|uniref:Hexosyltransferase n=1 Tax=Brachionus plicatilis TaxID=10195 RepID=A0A3M7RVQ1_BRAPC|nr:hypothetical protein BpHYR1_048970 [Brachionus plicatilis]